MDKPREIVTKQLRIDKLDHKGFGVSKDSRRFLQIWNALPGELVSVDFIKGKRFRKKSLTATEVLEKSPHRIEPLEKDHFLSCSPWQIVDWEEENKLKAQSVASIFKEHKIVGSRTSESLPEVVRDENQAGYRNKMEFSFYIDDKEEIHIAFHKRGSKGIIPVTGCMLASDVINETAEKIVKWINELKIPKKILKTVIIRSNQKGDAIAGLFIKEEIEFERYPKLGGAFKGFTVYYSNHKSPASVADKLLYQEGECELEEIIDGVILRYGLLSFFQINIPIFEKALEAIHAEIPEGMDVIDFYSGVGSISLPIADRFKSVTLVDSNKESIEFAKKNITENNIKNAEAICLPAEKITEIITSDKIILVDPPRSGMHSAVVDKLLEELPSKIIYLSCNPVSQAIDLERLQEKISDQINASV